MIIELRSHRTPAEVLSARSSVAQTSGPSTVLPLTSRLPYVPHPVAGSVAQW